MDKSHKNPEGGLNSKGRAYFNNKGANLKPPVDKAPETLEEIRRQGQFLTRMYNRDKIPPLKKPNGKPSRYALQAQVWNSPVPKTIADVRRLAAKGKALLDKYKRLKEKAKSNKTKQKLSQSEFPELPLILSNGMIKVPVAKKGKWFHDVHGIVSFTDKDFEEIKKESSKEVLGFTPYITYGHPANLPYETVDGELKKGDLKGWEEDNDILFALFEAKEDTFNLVKNGEYEYSSGEFLRNYTDKFTGVNKGTVLMRVALTNSPFIPFGDTKVEALSQKNKEYNFLPNSVPYVIKLSTDIQENINPLLPEEIPPKINMTLEKTPDQLAEEVVSQLMSKESETKVETKDSLNETKKLSNTKEDINVPVATSAVDINALFEKFANQALEASKSAVDAVTSKYEVVVSNLNNQIEVLKNQLANQEQVTQAFSTSLTNQAKAQQMKELASYGIPPILIQKFSQVQEALNTKQSIIKLSTKATNGEVVVAEYPVIEVIKEMLVSAVNSEPVLLQQFGQTSTVIPSNNLQASIQQLVEQNKLLVNKKSLV